MYLNVMTQLIEQFPLIRCDTLETMEMLKSMPEMEELTDNELLGIPIRHFGLGGGNKEAILVVNGRVEVRDGKRVWINQEDNFIDLSTESANKIIHHLDCTRPTMTDNLEIISTGETPITVDGSRVPLYHYFLFDSWHRMMLLQELQQERTKMRRELRKKEKNLANEMEFFILRG